MYDIWKIVAGIVVGELIIMGLRAAYADYLLWYRQRSISREISKWQSHVRRVGD